MTDRQTLLKVLLKQRHQQTHTAFIREYDAVAEKTDPRLVRRGPSKAQFYRWLSGEVASVPYADHCRILEAMFPGWTVAQLLQPHDGGISYLPEPPSDTSPVASLPADKVDLTTTSTIASNDESNPVVHFYPHRSDTQKQLWMDLLHQTKEHIDLFSNASLFLPEDNPNAIDVIKEKAKAGVNVRIMRLFAVERIP